MSTGTAFSNWVLYTNNDMQSSYAMSDTPEFTNNVTEVLGVVTISTILKYQPMATPISLVNRPLIAYPIVESALNNIDSQKLMKPYQLLKPIQKEYTFST